MKIVYFLLLVLWTNSVFSTDNNADGNTVVSYSMIAYINRETKSKLEFNTTKPGIVTVLDLIRYIGLLQDENDRLVEEKTNENNIKSNVD